MAMIVNLPQRFQAVDGLSPTAAGLRLLPLLLCSPFASGLSGVLVTKFKIPPFYIILFGSVLQLIGIGLSSSISTNLPNIPSTQYGYEILMGFGFGFGLSTLLLYVPLIVSKKDTGEFLAYRVRVFFLILIQAVTMGAITQVRVLGGTIGLALW